MSYKHNRTLPVKFGELDDILKWCEAQCGGRWAFMDPIEPMDFDSWTFLFDSDEDFILFLMKWT